MSRISSSSAACPSCVKRPANVGRNFHESGELLHRHMHAQGFFALVLGGSYVEAGDTGRHRVEAGDVIVHQPFERHLDRFSAGGAAVLVLPLLDKWPDAALARVGDPDSIVRLAERDVVAASEALAGAMIEKPSRVEDWPDLLARDLLAEPGLALSYWAQRHGLHPGSLARGFGQEFGISPAAFRTAVRSRRAVRRIVSGVAPLCAIASEEGFADQAHMSRAIKHATGLSPRALRRRLAMERRPRRA